METRGGLDCSLVGHGLGHDAEEEVETHAQQQADLLLARDGPVQELLQAHTSQVRKPRGWIKPFVP